MHGIQNLPGEQVQLGVGVARRPGQMITETTLGTRHIPFEVVKPMLSSEPCRRPNRNKPLSEQSIETEDAAFVERCRNRLAKQRDE